MNKVWGLFVGDKLITKSEKCSELIPMRDQYLSEGKDAYISIWLGRLDKEGKSIKAEKEESDNADEEVL